MPLHRLLTQSKRTAKVSIVVALFCFVALAAHALIKPFLGQHVSASFFYIPAGVNIIAMLALGNVATIGIGGSVLVWALFVREFDAAQSVALALSTVAVCMLALWIHRQLRKLRITGRPPPTLTISLADAVMFTVIYGLINSVTKELLLSPLLYGKPPSVADMSLKFTGDVFGGITVFVAANLTISAWISWKKWRAQSE